MGNAVESLEQPFNAEERPTVRAPAGQESEIRIAVSRPPAIDEELLVDDSWDESPQPPASPSHRPSARPTRPVPSGVMKRRLETCSYSQILLNPDERKNRRKA